MSVIVIEFITLDGFVSDPDGAGGTPAGGWMFRFGPEQVAGDKFRLGPVLNSNTARWDHRPYYWKAVTNLGRPVFSHPHLSLTSGRTSVGVTIAFKFNDQVMVVGTELDWTSPHLAWPTVE